MEICAATFAIYYKETNMVKLRGSVPQLFIVIILKTSGSFCIFCCVYMLALGYYNIVILEFKLHFFLYSAHLTQISTVKMSTCQFMKLAHLRQ